MASPSQSQILGLSKFCNCSCLLVFFYSKFLPLNFDSHALTRRHSLTVNNVIDAVFLDLGRETNFYVFFYFGSDFL